MLAGTCWNRPMLLGQFRCFLAVPTKIIEICIFWTNKPMITRHSQSIRHAPGSLALASVSVSESTWELSPHGLDDGLIYC